MRFFSRRRTARGLRTDSGYDKRGRHLIVCKVILLDGTDITVDLQVSRSNAASYYVHL